MKLNCSWQEASIEVYNNGLVNDLMKPAIDEASPQMDVMKDSSVCLFDTSKYDVG